jgi:hypothetical protein
MKLGFLHKALILFFLGLVILFAFTAPSQKELNTDRLDFSVLESDALYFRNLRQYFYTKRTREDANYDLFYLKSNGNDSSQNAANFTIVSNWLNDMAYIMFTVDSSRIEPNHLVVSSFSDTFLLDAMNMEEHQYMASRVYASFVDDACQYFLVDENQAMLEIWKTREDRKKMKRVLKDYFRLVGAL